MRLIVAMLTLYAAVSGFVSCGDGLPPNTVDMEQVEMDGSTNDRYQFRDEIERNRKRENRYRKETF